MREVFRRIRWRIFWLLAELSGTKDLILCFLSRSWEKFMRLWSIHPKYLDTKWLLALWRETLLAKKVLEWKTKWYKNHPQLERFKKQSHPLSSINYYLSEIFHESQRREYTFSREKISWDFHPEKMPVNAWQVEYEIKHLRGKLQIRDRDRIGLLSSWVELHPIFYSIPGDIESWEKKMIW